MVFRLFCESLIWAQKPKSAKDRTLAEAPDTATKGPLTQFDVAFHGQKDII